MDNFLKSDMFSPTKLKDKLNSFITWVSGIVTTVSGKADKVTPATSGNFAGLDANGNLTDSGSKPADFAVTNHKHDYIQSNTSFSDGYGLVNVSGIQNRGGRITIGVTKLGLLEYAIIEYSNIGNLQRALEDPAAPISGGNVLVTNGQAYDAIKAAKDWAVLGWVL